MDMISVSDPVCDIQPNSGDKTCGRNAIVSGPARKEMDDSTGLFGTSVDSEVEKEFFQKFSTENSLCHLTLTLPTVAKSTFAHTARLDASF